MTVDLTQHLLTISADRNPLWIDAWRYGENLLNKGQPAPWDDVGQLVSFAGKLQALVASDVLMVEVQSFYDHWLAQNPALLQAMAEKRRLGYPLRTLLADEAARAQLHQVVQALCDSNSQLPLLLTMPSPRQWMARACCQARGIESVDVSWDDAESASMYLADNLRTYADCPLSGLLIRDEPGEGPSNASELARYQPLVNVAAHYQWQVVLDGCGEGEVDTAAAGGVLLLGADIGGLSGVRVTGIDEPPGVAASLPGNCYFHVAVPENATPERVLEFLDNLRRPGG